MAYAILYEIQGRLGKSSYYSAIMLAMNVIISLTLVTKYGGMGVAIGTTVSFFALQTLYLLDQHRFLKVPNKKAIILLIFSLLYGLVQYFIGENLLFRGGGAIMGLACLMPLIRQFNIVDKTILTNLLSGRLLSFRALFCRLLIQEEPVRR